MVMMLTRVVVSVVVVIMSTRLTPHHHHYCFAWTHATTHPTDHLLLRYPDQGDYNNMGPQQRVMVGVGGRADLPCNTTSPLSSEPALLVLWYKSGIYKPIYSLDLRSDPPTHWRNPSVLGSRATFHPANHALALQRIRPEDQGAYRCKVSFKTSPTLTVVTNLTVIVPPRRLAVYTDLGLEARSIVGPFTEGETLRLTCRATGGSPPPAVTWWEGKALLDMTSEVETLDLVSNTLVVPTLTRRDLHRTLTCQAANSNLTAPLLTTVTLDMNFPPLWVRLRSSREPVSAGQEYVVVCQAAGARPPATLTWRLGPTLLTSHHTKTSEGGNVTTSELVLSPDVEDAGKVLSCLAHSPAVPSRSLRDDWRLDVYYVPQSILRPGSSLNLTNIEEGDDVYFECSVKANPWVYKIVWLHESRELKHNVTGGVIISNQSLVLQHVDRTSSGNYFCVASNIEGDGKSNPVPLKVKYAPVCHDPQVTYHGAARLEQVNIPCHLDAHPRPYSYRWTFNNSGESVDIPQEHIQAGDSGSTVSYTPNTELDYGTLLCWGVNTVGRQRRPCVFHVFPAGRPDPVYNCSSYNLSLAAVYVRCVAGFDGGLPQTFIMELYDPHSDALLVNTTSSVPKFSVSGLPSGRALRGKVFSTNAKGGSDAVVLKVYTLKDLAEKRTAAVKPSPAEGQSSGVGGLVGGVVGVVLGVLSGLLLVLVLVCVLLRLRHDHQLRAGQGDNPHRQPAVPPHPSKMMMPPTILHDATPTPTDNEEKNPDVIPHAGKECDKWTGGEEGVTTISCASLPTTYVTLPRTRHLYTQSNTQGHVGGNSSNSSGGGEVIYAELELAGPQQKQQHSHHHHHHLEGLATLPPHRLSNNNNNYNNNTTTTSTTTKTDTSPHHPHSVVYATLDHKRLEANCSPTPLLHHRHHHHHASGYSHQQQTPLSGPNTPTHPHTTPTHSHITPTLSHTTTPTHLHTTPPHSHTTPTHLHTTTTPTGSHSHPGPSSGVAASPPWTPSPTRVMDRRYKQRRDTHCGSDTEASTPLINPSCQKESSV